MIEFCLRLNLQSRAHTGALNVLVEVYDRMGKKIGDIPDAKTSSALRDALQQTFQSAISPDHDGVIAII